MTSSTNNMLSRALRLGVPVCAGILAGVLSSVFFSRDNGPSASPDQRVTVIEKPSAPSSGGALARGSDVSRRDLARLSQRIDAMEEKMDDGAAPHTTPEPTPTPEEMEALKKAREEAITARIQAQAAETRDPAWAKESESLVSANMRAFADGTERGVHLDGVTCQSTGCIATLTFPSLAEARQNYGRYVVEAFGMRCAQTAELEEGDDPSAPTKARVLFSECLKDVD